jgi:hypothetical protein
MPRTGQCGKAKQGVDYTLSGAATIPAYQSYVNVTLHALEDNKKEKREKATMTLKKGSGYNIAKPSKATISFVDD